MNWTTALPSFLITLREGFEAALVVGIVLACLAKADRRDLNRWVYLGLLAGLLASLLLGLLLGNALGTLSAAQFYYAPALRLLLEALLCAIAVGLLSWMLIWMTRQSRSLKSEVEQGVRQAIQAGSDRAVFGIVFAAVLREGFETVIFLLTQGQRGWLPSLGAIAGLSGAGLLGWAIFRGSIRLNLRRFFQVMGVLLLMITGGLLLTALRKLDAGLGLLEQLSQGRWGLCQSTASCLLGPQLWDLQALLPDRQFPGLFLKLIAGYSDRLFLIPAIAYVVFWIGVGGLYFRSLQSPQPVKTPATQES